ncbi:STAS domain-containing protein [Actinoplanes sp. CA-030573]|uniref:STAS domain-containing protein n=1 Tax=Actinoplanes sp. CA-030573 TaxID=3239898 RepID=UPI003D918E51
MEASIQRTLADDGTATVRVRGEIDFANCDELAQCVRDALVAWSPTTVRIDVREATFIDSTGVGALIEGYKASSAAATRFIVVNPTHVFRRVLDVTGLSDLFGLATTEVEATGT